MLGKDIIQSFKEGDPDAFQSIYSLFYKKVFTYTYRYTLSRENAEELTHDVFLQLWKSRSYVNPEIGLNGYISTLSKNVVFTWLRNVSRSKKIRAQLEVHFFEQQEEQHPGLKIDATHDLEVLKRALNTLPPKRKLVFEMIRFKEMTYNEVAEQLCISRDAVKAHMVKANLVIEEMKRSKLHLDYVAIAYFFIFPSFVNEVILPVITSLF